MSAFEQARNPLLNSRRQVPVPFLTNEPAEMVFPEVALIE